MLMLELANSSLRAPTLFLRIMIARRGSSHRATEVPTVEFAMGTVPSYLLPGGLLPRPPPEGLPVLLGPFSNVAFILRPFTPE